MSIGSGVLLLLVAGATTYVAGRIWWEAPYVEMAVAAVVAWASRQFLFALLTNSYIKGRQ
jgi:hypothetical protein